MLNIAICDDEQKLRSALKKSLTIELELKGIFHNIHEFDSGESLLEKSEYFDIIFLDIEMKQLNGMETAKQIRKHSQRIVIIFVTSYPDYVFEGYEVQALNYILKPYKDEKIIKVLYEALSALDYAAERYYLVEQKSGTIKLNLREILYFQSDKRSILLVAENNKLSFYGKLSDVELELPDYFIRIHNRYLINLNFVNEIMQTSVSCGGISLPVSRQYKQKLAIAFAKNMLR